nr:LysR substrate-binding domain-containing protein [Marinobacterium profundum]
MRAFSLVVTTGSLAAAARELCLSQPAVSRLISVLEGELKLILFSRNRRRLVLTEQGELFYREARRILEGFDEIPQIVAEIKHQEQRQLRIVAMPRLAAGLVAPVIARFCQRHPTVRCSVDTHSRRDMEKWLASKRYDIAIATLPVTHSAIVTETLYHIRAEVLLPETHSLAAQEQLCAADLVGERLVGLLPGLLLRQQVDDIFNAAGLEAQYQIETASSMVACQIVRSHGGITIIDRLAVQGMDLRGLTLRPLEPARFMPFGLLYLKENETSVLASQFIEQLKGYLAELEQAWGGSLMLKQGR